MSAEITNILDETEGGDCVHLVGEREYMLVRLRDGRRIRIREIEDGIEVYGIEGVHFPTGTMAIFPRSVNVFEIKMIDR